MLELLAILPWAVFALVAPFVLRRGPRLIDYPAPRGGAGSRARRAGDTLPEGEAPLVSVVVPARNEARNISVCLATLLDSTYPDYEVIVVDDRSTDGTADIVRALAERSDGKLRLISGEPLPDGWFGKPWACWQGYRHARGELLLFTDADTRHSSGLLGHAVGALRSEGADLLSVMPQLLMKSFWERVIMPQIWLSIMLRYPDIERISRTRDPHDVIANGQFILVDRRAYGQVGGHEAVAGEVVEDLRLAQEFVTAGHTLFLAHAEELIETRMYRSLSGIIKGWSKNLAAGSRATIASGLRFLVPWLVAAFLLFFWALPPAVFVAALVTGSGTSALAWSAGASGASLFFWLAVHTRLEIPRVHALLYPVGAVAAAGLFVRSAVRGARITWKGREYSA